MTLATLLSSIPSCTACDLMARNTALGIPYVPVKPKPLARVVFVGRDPSPRTATVVGERGGRSVFLAEIFRIADAAQVDERDVYITDLCKCHWRTSVGTPLPGTEDRAAALDEEVASRCIDTWLTKEVELIRPKLLVGFGEEFYQLVRNRVRSPSPPPAALSASKSKSTMDAERWLVDCGLMAVSIGSVNCSLAVLRHPGNSTRLPKVSEKDKRAEFHRLATALVEKAVAEACA